MVPSLVRPNVGSAASGLAHHLGATGHDDDTRRGGGCELDPLYRLHRPGIIPSGPASGRAHHLSDLAERWCVSARSCQADAGAWVGTPSRRLTHPGPDVRPIRGRHPIESQVGVPQIPVAGSAQPASESQQAVPHGTKAGRQTHSQPRFGSGNFSAVQITSAQSAGPAAATQVPVIGSQVPEQHWASARHFLPARLQPRPAFGLASAPATPTSESSPAALPARPLRTRRRELPVARALARSSNRWSPFSLPPRGSGISPNCPAASGAREATAVPLQVLSQGNRLGNRVRRRRAGRQRATRTRRTRRRPRPPADLPANRRRWPMPCNGRAG